MGTPSWTHSFVMIDVTLTVLDMDVHLLWSPLPSMATPTHARPFHSHPPHNWHFSAIVIFKINCLVSVLVNSAFGINSTLFSRIAYMLGNTFHILFFKKFHHTVVVGERMMKSAETDRGIYICCLHAYFSITSALTS